MYIDPYYKVIQLKSFIGERKLKQVGLLHCQSCPPLSMIKNMESIKSSLVDSIKSEELTQEVLTRYSPTTCLYRSSIQHYGFVDCLPTDNDDEIEALEDDFVCPECGKLYHSVHSHSYEALPVYLSDVEVDAIKGIFVDLYL